MASLKCVELTGGPGNPLLPLNPLGPGVPGPPGGPALPAGPCKYSINTNSVGSSMYLYLV